MGRTLAEQIQAQYILNNPAAIRATTAAATAALIADTEIQPEIHSQVRAALTTIYNEICAAEHPADSWNPADDLFGCEDELADEADEAAIEADLLDDEPEGEHEHPAHGLTCSIPRLDKSGWLTPLSDPALWLVVYKTAWRLAVRPHKRQLDDLEITGPHIQNFNMCMGLRVDVCKLMESGDAGKAVVDDAGRPSPVPAKAVGPWTLGTDGETEMPWIRVIHGTPDPTTKPVTAGIGERRERMARDINGNPVHADEYQAAQDWLAKRRARQFEGTKRKMTVPVHDRLQEKRNQAHAAGEAARAHAPAGFEQTHYMWVYAATFRVLGEIHSEFEALLSARGISQEQVLATAAALKVNSE